MKIHLIISFVLLQFMSVAQNPAPLKQKFSTVMLTHGKVHTGTGEFFDNANVGIKDGKILFVKNSLTNPIVESEWDTIIDITGKHVYPGFIAPNVTLGITEIDAVRATRDFSETGNMNPHIRTLIGFNPNSDIIYTVRSNGVLVTQSTPRGGILSGTSSVMALDGWSWQEAVYSADDGVHLNWPKKNRKTGWWAEPGPIEKNDEYLETKRMIWEFFKAAEGYTKKMTPDETNLKFEALRGVFDGKKRLFFHVDFAPEINDVIDFSREFNLKYPVIVGGYDTPMLADRLKENHFSVIIGRPHSLPMFEGDLVSVYFELAAKLQAEGVLYCISNEGDMEAMGARNLPFMAGTAWSYGLTEEQAVMAITINAAKILGLDDRIGTLEKGKDATLFISEGNALDMRTNKGYLAMIKGNFVLLDNHQIQLYNRYKAKYDLK